MSTKEDSINPYSLGLAAWQYLSEQHRLSAGKAKIRYARLVHDGAGNVTETGDMVEREVEVFDPDLLSTVTAAEFDAACEVVKARLANRPEVDPFAATIADAAERLGLQPPQPYQLGELVYRSLDELICPSWPPRSVFGPHMCTAACGNGTHVFEVEVSPSMARALAGQIDPTPPLHPNLDEAVKRYALAVGVVSQTGTSTADADAGQQYWYQLADRLIDDLLPLPKGNPSSPAPASQRVRAILLLDRTTSMAGAPLAVARFFLKLNLRYLQLQNPGVDVVMVGEEGSDNQLRYVRFESEQQFYQVTEGGTCFVPAYELALAEAGSPGADVIYMFHASDGQFFEPAAEVGQTWQRVLSGDLPIQQLKYLEIPPFNDTWSQSRSALELIDRAFRDRLHYLQVTVNPTSP